MVRSNAPDAAEAAAPKVEPWPALDEAFLELSAATLGFRLGKPQPLAIARDGSVLFRRTGARDKRSDLYVLEPGGEVKTLVSVDTLLAG
ncbi:MAG: hypothetical protein ABW321_27870, partial [Polyangiales bacterium]